MGNYVFCEEFKNKLFSGRENKKAKTVGKYWPLIVQNGFNHSKIK
jgi:hypothetical protein